jgi:hypothetical protein
MDWRKHWRVIVMTLGSAALMLFDGKGDQGEVNVLNWINWNVVHLNV